MDEGLGGGRGAAEEGICALDWVSDGEAALPHPKGEVAMKVIVDGLGAAEDGREKLGSQGVLNRGKEGSDVWDDAADVVPFGREA